jgi:hypothetical protein
VDLESGLLHRLEVVVYTGEVEGRVYESFDFFVIVLVDEVAGKHTHTD